MAVDVWHIVSRLANWLSCAWSYRTGKMNDAMPTSIALEPANICQLRCPECPVGQGIYRKKGAFLDLALLDKILDESAPYAHTIIFYFQGEPLLHAQLPEMIRRAKQKHFYTYLSTNLQAITPTLAHNLIAAGIDHIVASIDGITQASYETYRQGGSLDKAMQGLRLLQQEKKAQKKHVVLEWQCLKLATNEHEWQEIQERYKSLGADTLTFKTAQLYDYEHGNPLMPSQERDSRYKRIGDKYVLKKRMNRRCRRLFFNCVIDVHGNVLPCCYDKEGKYALGNIQENSLRDIWLSAKSKAFRKQIAQQKDLDICSNCGES